MKDRPINDALRFVMERNRVLLGVSMLLFAMDGLTFTVSHLARATLPLVITWLLLRALARGYFRPGLLRSLDSARRGDGLSVDELTSGSDMFDQAIGAQVVTDLVVFASLVVGGLPGFGLIMASIEMARPALYAPGLALSIVGAFSLYLYAYTGVRFSEHIVALERRGMWSALGRSWKLARGKRLRILHVVFVASTLELGALFWGLGALGFGVFFTIPLLRLAGDHVLVGLFTTLQKEDRDAKPTPAPSSSSWAFRHAAAARGASLLEYALIIGCILLVAAGAFRGLGAATSKNANKANAVLASGGGGNGSGSAGGAGGTGGVASAIGTFVSDFASGFFKGDFSTSTGAGKIAGQVVAGFIPIYGQAAAVRDAAAAIRDISNGKKDGWTNLVLAGVGFIPGGKAVGATVKGAEEAVQVAKAAEEIAVAAKAAKATEEAAAVAKAAAGDAKASAAAAAAAKEDAQLVKDAENVEKAATKAEQIESGGLKAHEGGPKNAHTLSDHVGLTDQQLADRLAAKPGYKETSTFSTEAQAEEAINQTLAKDKDKVAAFLNNPKQGREVLHLDPPAGSPSTGTSLTRGGTPTPVSGARVVLVKDTSMPGGYRILTAFPEK